MASTGDEVLIVGEEIALTSTLNNPGEAVLLHAEDVGRGDSTVTEGDDVVLVSPDKAQGQSVGNLVLQELRVDDKAPTTGQDVLLRVSVENTGNQKGDYTVDWFRDGGQIATQTKTVPANGEVEFQLTETQEDAGCFSYEANTAGPLEVCWSLLDPGPLTATPGTVYLKAGQDTTTLEITVSNPTTQDLDTIVNFTEDGTSIETQNATISAGGSQTFTHDVTYTNPQQHDYTARITENTVNGLTQETNPEEVLWSERELILENFRVDDKALFKGDSTTLRVDALNVTDTDQSFTVEFTRGGNTIATPSQTVPSKGSTTFTAGIQQSTVGCRGYKAEQKGPLQVCWSNLRPGPLTVDPEEVLIDEGEDTTTLSVTIENPSSMDVTTDVVFREEGSQINAQTRTIAAGNTVTLTHDVTKTNVGFYTYTADIRDNSSGVTSTTNPKQVAWTNETSTFSGLNPDFPTTVLSSQETTATIEPGGSDLKARVLTSTDDVFEIGYEDSTQLDNIDYNDDFFEVQQGQWDAFGYFRVVLRHGKAAFNHDTDVGTYSDSHSGSVSNFSVVFDLRFFDDGNVYDLNGNQVGTWR